MVYLLEFMLPMPTVIRQLRQLRQLHATCRQLKETHYDVLKLPHDSTLADIKTRFKKLSLKLHPDMLKSQGLHNDELDKRAEEYLHVKKSYEVLSDTKKRHEYDLQSGIKRRDGTSSNEFFKQKGTMQHFHEASAHSRKNNDVPHFDSKKHQERNERVERRFMYNQKISQNVDTFGRDLYARNISKDGPRKRIYRDYGRPVSVHDQEEQGRKLVGKVVGAVVGVLVVWYALLGGYTTPKKDSTTKETVNKTTSVQLEDVPELKNGKGRNKMNVNNQYGLMLIKKELDSGYVSPSDMEVFEEQISETVE